MTKTQIQRLIENLRVQTAANTISPDMLATILTCLNDAPSTVNNTYIETPPLLYCEVVNGKLYLRNSEYYLALGLKPILFRYIRWHNRYRLKKKDMHAPLKKGWHANGLQGTLKINSDGQVLRTKKVINDFHSAEHSYSEWASTFVNDGQKEGSNRVTWGCQKIDIMRHNKPRMIRLPFAIAFAENNRLQSKAIKVSDLQSNLAPFFVRGQGEHNKVISWRFSK